MNVLFLTGNHPRHYYMAQCLEEAGLLKGVIIEAREPYMPPAPGGVSEPIKQMFIEHFKGRDCAEHAFFGDAPCPKSVKLEVSREQLNSQRLREVIKEVEPDLLLSYGVHKLSNETLSAASCPCWNIHGGLSPWYRGCITHFWPSYMMEPQMTGMTVHELTQDIDGGDVIHQTLAPLVRGDGIHDLACRAVQSLGNEIAKLVQKQLDGDTLSPIKHSTSGRIWRAKDWSAKHLEVIYKLQKNRPVDYYLDRACSLDTPKCIRQF